MVSIAEMNGQSVADNIIKIMENKKFYSDIVKYLENEEKINLESINKFYQLVD